MAGNGENEGLGGGDEVHDEREPLVQPTYLHFRQGRQSQNAGRRSVCSGLILPVFKVFFCSLGLWGHRKWNYIPRVLFVVICITQAGYQISFDCRCPYFDFYQKVINQKYHKDTNEILQTTEMCFTIFSLAAVLSYSIFLGCLIASRRQDSALVSPSISMAEVVDSMEVVLLFFAFIVIMASFLSGIILLFNFESLTRNVIQDKYIVAPTVVLTHWASFYTCHVFAISSLTFGKCFLKHFSFDRKESLRYHFHSGRKRNLTRFWGSCLTILLLAGYVRSAHAVPCVPSSSFSLSISLGLIFLWRATGPDFWSLKLSDHLILKI